MKISFFTHGKARESSCWFCCQSSQSVCLFLCFPIPPSHKHVQPICRYLRTPGVARYIPCTGCIEYHMKLCWWTLFADWKLPPSPTPVFLGKIGVISGIFWPLVIQAIKNWTTPAKLDVCCLKKAPLLFLCSPFFNVGPSLPIMRLKNARIKAQTLRVLPS